MSIDNMPILLSVGNFLQNYVSMRKFAVKWLFFYIRHKGNPLK